MSNPKITVALTTYNRPEYLKNAIESILLQTFTEFEFLILDNGSESETEELIKTYTDRRIKYVRNKINSRDFVNVAWDLSNGEYLIITHDDDMMKKDMLEKELAVLNNFHDVIAVSCNNTLIDSFGNVIKEKSISIDSPLKIKQFEYSHYHLNKNIYLTFPCVLMRKSFFLTNNLKFELNVGPGADTYLWIKANLLPSSYYIIEEPLYYYRIHKEQDSVINNLSLNIDLYEALFDLFLNVNYLKNLSRVTNILLRGYVKNLYHKLITRESYNGRVEALMVKLRQIKLQRSLLIELFIFRHFVFLFKVYYWLLQKNDRIKL